VLQAYREHVAERAELNIPPNPLNAEQVADLVELLKNPPAGEEAFLLELISRTCPARCGRGRLRESRLPLRHRQGRNQNAR
jgi:aconitase B